MGMISSRQAKLARIFIDLTQAEVADAIGVTSTTITNIEKSNKISETGTLGLLQKFFESRGVEFLPGDGIREKEDIITVYEGETAEAKLHEDIYETCLLLGDEAEVLIYGLEEGDPNAAPEVFERAKTQVKKLIDIGVNERILGVEGNTNYVAPWDWYRWLPKEGFASVPIFQYGNKIGLYTFSEPYKTIIIDNSLFADTFKHLFNFAWSRSIVPPAGKSAITEVA